MRKLSAILRLRWEKGLSVRQISNNINISRSTVQDYLTKADRAGLSWPLPEVMSDAALEELLFPRARKTCTKNNQPDFAYIHKELRKKGVTLELLWKEHKSENPDGYQYSRFCDLFKKWCCQIDVAMRQVYKAGEKFFAGWANQTISIVDKDTGEIQKAYIFVAFLGASNYTYAEASLNHDLKSWIAANCRALNFNGGVPLIIVPYNATRAAVKPIHAVYQEMADHYGTVILPDRSKKPKNNEMVQYTENLLLDPLKNCTFYSFVALKQALSISLKNMNERPFERLQDSRKALFESLDRPALRSMPSTPYEFSYKRLQR